MNKTITVSCFVLQGLGNDLLLTLKKYPYVKISAIYTRNTNYYFGYYQCDPIEVFAQEAGVPLYYIPEKGPWDCEPADIAIIASYHRIFKRQHIDKYKFAINIHPSLLPAYRGATPTNWMIRNGETITGLTAYLLEEGIDEGRFLFQNKILNPYLYDNQLRKALSFASRDIVDDIICKYPDYKILDKPSGEGSYHRARNNDDSILDLNVLKSVEELIFHIKAFTNFPMPKLNINGKLFVIDYENPRTTFEINIGQEYFNILGYWLDSGKQDEIKSIADKLGYPK